MNITKELLESLGVVSMSLSNGREDFLCILRRTEGKSLTFSILNSDGFSAHGKMELRTTFKKDGAVKVSVSELEVLDSGGDWCVGTVAGISDREMNSLLDKLSEMEYRDEKYGRRKEMRVPIGKANYAAFGLSSPEQTLFVRGLKFSQPCAVLDASIHGIQVITPIRFKADFKALEDFNIKISFVNPEETAILKAHKVHSKLDRAGEKIFATYSCQLLEPIHHVWKERVIKMIEASERPLEIISRLL